MRSSWLIALVLGLVAVLAAPAIGAPPDTVELSWQERQVGPETIDWQREAGQTWHVRGWTADYEIMGEPDELISGDVEVVVNWNVNFRTWRGNLWGTTDFYSDVYPDSGWETTWSARWTGPGEWSGHGVGHGFGEFEGMKIRYEVSNIPMPPGTFAMDTVSAIVFTPGQP